MTASPLAAGPLAAAIVADILERRPFEPHEGEIASLEQAYRLQDIVTQALCADRPDRRIAGYKIAFNRRASLDYYGLSEPCYAPLFSDQIYASGVTIPRAAFDDLVLEPEVAIQLAAPVSGGEDDAALTRAIGAILPAIEIMDARGAFPRDPSAAAAVAQRIHNEGAVLGEAHAFDGFDAASVETRLSLDGALTGQSAAAPPQAPLVALAWLAGRLARDGKRLESGMVVLTGALLPGYAVPTSGALAAEIQPLGRVAFNLT